MTLNEAATTLGTTPDNLRGAIRRGSLQATKHGRDWWVEDKEVKRYARENARTSREARQSSAADEPLGQPEPVIGFTTDDEQAPTAELPAP